MEINREAVLKLQRAYIDAMRAQREPLTISHDGQELVVLPGVFPPYLDSELVIRAMRIEETDTVLEVGSGSGVIAISAASKAQRVIATDINPEAIKTVRANADRLGLQDRLTAIEADLFPTDNTDPYDVVIFNPPYTDHSATDLAERSVWDPGHKTIRRFFAKLPNVLHPQSRLYLGWADFADLEFIERLMAQHGACFSLIDDASDGTSRFVVYEAIFPHDSASTT